MAAGWLGFGLGVWNAWMNYRKERVRLRVELGTSRFGRPAIKVLNLSSFAVVLDDAGLVHKSGKRLSAAKDFSEARWNLPVKVDPRVSIPFELGSLEVASLAAKDIVAAYGRTQCGTDKTIPIKLQSKSR